MNPIQRLCKLWTDNPVIFALPPPSPAKSAKARRSIGQWADDFLASQPEMTKPKPLKTGMASAVGKSLALGAIVPLVDLVAAPFLLFKPVLRIAANTVAEQKAAIAEQVRVGQPAQDQD